MCETQPRYNDLRYNNIPDKTARVREQNLFPVVKINLGQYHLILSAKTLLQHFFFLLILVIILNKRSAAIFSGKLVITSENSYLLYPDIMITLVIFRPNRMYIQRVCI